MRKQYEIEREGRMVGIDESDLIKMVEKYFEWFKGNGFDSYIIEYYGGHERRFANLNLKHADKFIDVCGAYRNGSECSIIRALFEHSDFDNHMFKDTDARIAEDLSYYKLKHLEINYENPCVKRNFGGPFKIYRKDNTLNRYECDFGLMKGTVDFDLCISHSEMEEGLKELIVDLYNKTYKESVYEER